MWMFYVGIGTFIVGLLCLWHSVATYRAAIRLNDDSIIKYNAIVQSLEEKVSVNESQS